MTAENGISGPGGLRGARRRSAVTEELVRTGPVPGNPGKFPLMLTPAVENVDLAAWSDNQPMWIAWIGAGEDPVISDPGE